MKPEIVAIGLNDVPTWSKGVGGEFLVGSGNDGMNSIDNGEVVVPDSNG
jgi:hypothetical protein